MSSVLKSMGITRNLQHQYQKFRKENKQRKPRTTIELIDSHRNDEGTQALLGNLNRDIQTKAKMLPPEWVDIYEDLEEQLEQIEFKLEELKKKQGISLRTSFGGNKAKEEVTILGHEVITMIKNCEEGIKKLTSFRVGDAQVVTNAQKVLAGRLQRLTLRQRQYSKTYMSEMSSLHEPESSVPTEEYDFESLAQDPSTLIAMERTREIDELVDNLKELGEVFKELNILVVEQGTILDRIDYNIEQGVKYTSDAVQDLVKAEKHQKSMRATWCIILLIVLILFFAIVYMFKLEVF